MSTHYDEIKLFFGYKRLCNGATCHGLCDLGVIKSARSAVIRFVQEGPNGRGAS
jgi:hypothetical protein